MVIDGMVTDTIVKITHHPTAQNGNKFEFQNEEVTALNLPYMKKNESGENVKNSGEGSQQDLEGQV